MTAKVCSTAKECIFTYFCPCPLHGKRHGRVVIADAFAKWRIAIELTCYQPFRFLCLALGGEDTVMRPLLEPDANCGRMVLTCRWT